MIKTETPFEAKVIAKAVELFDISKEDLFKKGRKASIVRCRTAISYILHKIYYMKAFDVGNLLGDKNHSTVTHYCLIVHPQLVKSKAFEIMYTAKYNELLNYCTAIKSPVYRKDSPEFLEDLLELQSLLREIIKKHKLFESA